MRKIPATYLRGMFLLAGLAIIIAIAWACWPSGSRGAEPTFASLRQDLLAGKPASAGNIRRAATENWQQNRLHVMDMLASDHWQERSVACEIIGAQPDTKLTWMLVRSANDSDWRVRAAAFEGLMSIHRPAGWQLPHQNTPLDDRERILLAWLHSYDGESRSGLASQLCEIQAFSRHSEFGKPLASQCLACHAGSQPAPPEAARNCESCHAAIVDQWSGSAHANSLSHLKLATVDAATRAPRTMSFEPIRGINCSQCHADKARSAVAASSRSPAGTIESAKGSCAACHASANQQWQAWRSSQHSRVAMWPPGQLETVTSDDRTCVDCHMPIVSRQPSQRSHAWSCRRNPQLLASACDVSISGQARGKAIELKLTITNLAGHDFPTGTSRRAIRIEAAADAGEVQTVAVLTPASIASEPAGQSALPPGSAKTFTISVPASTETLTVDLTFVRDTANPDFYRLKFLTRTFDLKQLKID